MSQIIFAIHCALVFGVPTLFGWVLWRRVFHEANWLALAPGATVTGFALLMAIVNELRCFLEMGPAIWFAYKLLLALTLVLVMALPARAPRPRLPGCTKRGWQLLLVLIGVLCTSAYFGVPALNGFLHDAWWFHYPTAIQIQTVEHFPLNHVFALDDPLYYHFGPDILAAIWSFLLDRPVQFGFALNLLILAPCTFLLAFALMARLARNYWAALLGASFLVVGGNLRFLLFLTEGFTDALGALRVFNSQTIQGLLQMAFTPSQILGVPLVLIILLLFRHVSIRPTWRMTAVLGLLLGALSLVAEWYFLPLLVVLPLISLRLAWRRHAIHGRIRSEWIALAAMPVLVAVLWGSFNNTYLSGSFGYFWWRYGSVHSAAQTRQISESLRPPADISLLAELKTPAEARIPAVAGARLSASARKPLFVRAPARPGETFEEEMLRSAIAPNAWLPQPAWTAPVLVPLQLNLHHFGQVPSWESAESDTGSFIPILGFKFLMEAMPVLLVGLPFGLWLAWRRRSALLLALAGLAAGSALPPVFLDWGYRSTDFLRFFTASFCFSALFLGWLAGQLLARASWPHRMMGGMLAAGCLVAPVGLGILGLSPGVLKTATHLSDTAQSLSQVAAKAPAGTDSALSADRGIRSEAARQQAFKSLAMDVDHFLFPLTKGRDRAIVVVPVDQVPKVKYFPEWMKMATLSHILLPIGWHWHDSVYAAYYREAVTTMDANALISLDAKWVIVSNVFLESVPVVVGQSLRDRTRFVPAATFRAGDYYMSVFKVLP